MPNANGRRRPARGKPSTGASRRPAAAKAVRKSTPAPQPPRTVEPAASGPFRLGAIPGATPGKWIGVWKDRRSHQPLELVPLAVADQRAALDDGTVDAALVRLPIDREGLNVIPLYDETTVVVIPAESHLAAADDLELADLAGEVLIVPEDDVLAVDAPGTVPPTFAPPATTEGAVATVATGVGILLVPMSLARLHHRRDADHRPLRDGPVSTVALAWPTERTTASVEAFVGIVRGRTANSSRD